MDPRPCNHRAGCECSLRFLAAGADRAAAVIVFLLARAFAGQRFGCLAAIVARALLRCAFRLGSRTRGIARTVASAFVAARDAIGVALSFAGLLVRHVP